MTTMRPMEIVFVIIVFIFVGWLYLKSPEITEEREICQRTCDGKEFIYIPRHLSGIDSLYTPNDRVSDCICFNKTH
jgi:hypothetical protein